MYIWILDKLTHVNLLMQVNAKKITASVFLWGARLNAQIWGMAFWRRQIETQIVRKPGED